MLAEEVSVLDADSPLWLAARPLLDAAFRLEQNDDTYSWYGWSKRSINAFLKRLPAHCSLVVGVWDTIPATEDSTAEQELLVLGCVCEVVEGEIRTIHTFESFTDVGLSPVKELEPGFEHALEIMRVVRMKVAPVAWALFTDKATWNEWAFASNEAIGMIDKGELLASLAQQGRCVLLGNQAVHYHS